MVREIEGLPGNVEDVFGFGISLYNQSALLCDFLQQYLICLVTGTVMRVIIEFIQCCSKKFAV